MNLNYLFTPTNTIVDPPIDTKSQDLPLEKLSWEDFEKLCLAVVQTEFSINDCDIYGIKGQSQEGIDIYARQSNGRYSSYQCKRYQKFDLCDLNKAVEHFKTKKFYNKSDNLHLCTSCEWSKTGVQDRFEKLKTEFENQNKTLIKWDKKILSKILKDKPQIVFDFFGLEWVKKFNGEIALPHLSKSKKYDANQIAKFRKELFDFYFIIFNIQDPGIPFKELNHPFLIQDRFIIPEILSNVKEESFESTKENSNTAANLDQYYYLDDYSYSLSENQFRHRRWNNQNGIEETGIEIRIKIDEALVSNNRNIVIGDPGSGKSTLLRYLVLDILNSNPQLENISQKYGKTLPVWLPFAFITKHLSQNDSLSISDILNLWFKSFDKTHLYKLSKEALEDKRLLLIIDGIDEWNSISSARLAILKIEAIIKLHDCKVLYSSRPFGFRILKDAFKNLNVLTLAGFSKDQQRSFVEKWYDKWTSLQENIEDKNYTKNLTDNFVKELEQAGDLKKLAETPLMLSILIIQKIQDSVLPKNKLEALKEITQYLIKKHPTKRIADAGIVQDKTNDIDFKDIFCELAIYIQRESNNGVILKSEAQKIIEQYLITYAEYDKAKAKVYSQNLLEVGANYFGLIIEKSINEIAFGHKQFQEFLAAQQLSESDEDLANEFIKQYAANPAFHQVIISFFGLIPLRQVKNFKKHFEVLKETIREKYQEDYLSLISYEVAINSDNTPSEIMNEAFDSIVRDFEFETNLTYKKALLKRILTALQNGRLKEKVQKFLIQYFPNQNKYKDYRVIALRYANHLNEEQLEFLMKTFINGAIELRLDASFVFNKHIKNENVFKFIKEIILYCSNPSILAFAINSIITNDIAEQEREELIKSIEVDDPLIHLYLIKYKIFTKKHTQDDLKLILPILNQIPYQLNQEAVSLLTDGFEKDDFLKKTLIKSVGLRKFQEDKKTIIESGIAWTVLFHSFNKDLDVINLIKSQFENEEFPFASNRSEIFQKMGCYFKDSDDLIPAVEMWLNKRLNKFNQIGPEEAYASAFVHTDKIKNTLLENLPLSYISHWNVMALLDGWRDNKEIKERLKDYFKTIETKKTSFSANFICKVFDSQEKDEAIKILEKILFDISLTFRERSIFSLIEIDKEYFESIVLKKLIDEIETFPKEGWGQYYTAIDVIVKNFHSNVIVQNYILERVENDNYLYYLAIQYYPGLIQSEERLLKKSIHLSKELRLLILEAFSNLSILPKNIEKTLYDFEKEAENEIMANMAICLFNHIKETNSNKIIELCKPLVFAKGFDFDIKRNIAFAGFLISQKLIEYFIFEDTENKSKDKSRLLSIFNKYSDSKYSSEIIIRSIVDNFDNMLSYAGKDFESIFKHFSYNKNIEDIWGGIASHSSKSSPTYSHLMEFISNHTSSIKNFSIISFLNRTSQKSPIFKEILLRLINDSEKHNQILAGRLLGSNFKNDYQVYNKIILDISHLKSGNIIALCIGWHRDPILKDLFDDIVKNEYQVDNHVVFSLNFLFQEVNNLIKYLQDIISKTSDTKRFHRYFFIPMIERMKRDKIFCNAIKNLLLSSNEISEKISYYNLLSQVNMLDEDIIEWKNNINEFKNDHGYDIVSNKTVRLKDILHDYYF